MPERAEPRAFWSGTITFGLVSVPVDLLPANRPRRASLRLLGPDGTPLRRRYWCPREEREVEDDEIVRGYEVAEGRFVVVTDEELDALAPEKSREIDLRRFVDRDEIDPVYFERAYFLAPAEGGVKPYRLLAGAMESTGKAGIATFVMRGKEYLVAILAEAGLLRAETMRFASELRSPEEADLPAVEEPPDSEVRRWRSALKLRFADAPDPAELEDRRSRAIERIAAAKLAEGDDVVTPPTEASTAAEDRTVIDLMAELKRRMAGQDPAGRAGAGIERLESRTKDDLYAMARRLEIAGRSRMTKDELVRAIRRSA